MTNLCLHLIVIKLFIIIPNIKIRYTIVVMFIIFYELEWLYEHFINYSIIIEYYSDII